MEMCILPECQMTGNPNTAGVCEGCFRAHMDMEKKYRRGTRHQEDDKFVMVNNQREEDRIPRRVDSSERVQSDIINRREALLNKLGMEDRPRSQPRQSPPERRQDAPPQQMLPQQMQSQQMRSAPVPSREPVLTVKKDLCATPGCHGVRLKNTNLCRTCKEDKKGSTERHRDTPVMRSEPQRQPHTPFQEPLRKCEIRKCDQLAAPPEFKYCLECLEDIEPQSSASSLPMGTPPEAVGCSAPELPHRPQNYGPQRQLRGVFVSSPIYSTSVQKYRSKCQRPGGCPDGMFGDPAKKNLCSKCWIEVGAVMPATQRAPSADQGKYDTTYAGRA